MVLLTLDEWWRFANYVITAGVAPKGMDKPEHIIIAMQTGAELLLDPMQSIQNIAVIGGRPVVWGDMPLALVRRSGLLERFEEHFDGQGDALTAVCTSKRVGCDEPRTTRFGVADARRAGLWGKAGPWTQYPQRQLMFRARGYNLRDEFGDVLKGMASEMVPGEVIDATPWRDVTPEDPNKSRTDNLVDRLKAAGQVPVTDHDDMGKVVIGEATPGAPMSEADFDSDTNNRGVAPVPARRPVGRPRKVAAPQTQEAPAADVEPERPAPQTSSAPAVPASPPASAPPPWEQLCIETADALGQTLAETTKALDAWAMQTIGWPLRAMPSHGLLKIKDDIANGKFAAWYTGTTRTTGAKP